MSARAGAAEKRFSPSSPSHQHQQQERASGVDGKERGGHKPMQEIPLSLSAPYLHHPTETRLSLSLARLSLRLREGARDAGLGCEITRQGLARDPSVRGREQVCKCSLSPSLSPFFPAKKDPRHSRMFPMRRSIVVTLRMRGKDLPSSLMISGRPACH